MFKILKNKLILILLLILFNLKKQIKLKINILNLILKAIIN